MQQFPASAKGKTLYSPRAKGIDGTFTGWFLVDVVNVLQEDLT